MTNYKTFICYRGDDIDNGIGKKIGKQIYQLIGENHPIFGKTFFAPMEKNYNFVKEGEQIIKQIKYFIIILSPDFFSDFSISKTFEKINEESVTYMEIQTAFENKSCRFLPVLVYGFDWKKNSQHYIKVLKNYYSHYDTHRLYHEAGVQIRGNNFTFNDLKKLIPISAISRPNININTLYNHLQKSSNTIYGLRIPLKKEDCETDIYRYNNNTKKYFMPSAFFEEYEKVANSCKLPKTDFYYWHVDLEELEDYNKPEITICSICFGIMLLKNWFEKDMDILIKKKNIVKDSYQLQNMKQTINGATNLLIALRSPEQGSWPAIWDFSETGVEGTINQTTLSLSALLTSDFLSLDRHQESVDVLKSRYKYILKSINWLIDASNTTETIFGDLTGWSHMANNTDIILLPTTFSFDTLLKFRNCLEEWIPYFLVKDQDFSKELSDQVERIEKILHSVILYFNHENMQYTGAFKRIINDEHTSISHTAKVLKTLLQYVQSTERTAVTADSIAMANSIIKNICDNFVKLDVSAVLNLRKHETFERFSYNKNTTHKSVYRKSSKFTRNHGENYEICGELIYIDAVINASSYYMDKDKDISDILFNKAFKVYSIFQKNAIREYTNKLLVKGKRKEVPIFPIYCLYYYRLCVYDFITYQKLKEVDND